jgi:hypothetical protein
MEISTGTVEGTAAVIKIECGFLPSWVDLYNIDGDAVMFWTKDMAAGEGYKIIGATGVGALMSSGGVTAAVHSDESVGFTIGTDLDVNASAETICWKAGH